MTSSNNYLSEFENEWRSDSESMSSIHDEFEFESENEFDSESDTEFEDNEHESDTEFENDEFESDQEFEIVSDGEYENDNEGNSLFEDKLYSVLKNNYESELEFEQQVNEVLHELDTEYFMGGLRKAFKKFKSSNAFKGLKKFAGKTPFGAAIKQYTALARGDIKGMLKGLAGQALSAAVPGGGIAKQLLNLEAPITSNSPRRNAQVINQVAKKSYGNLINQMGKLKGNQLGLIKNLGKSSFNQALQQVQTGSKRNVRYIMIQKGQTLVVRVR